MASTTSLALNSTAVNEVHNSAQRADDIVLADETAVGTTTGSWVDVGEGRNMDLLLTWANVAGSTPTLDVTVETSRDKAVADAARAVNSLSTAGAFAQKTTTSGTQIKNFGPTSRYVRVVGTVGGTSTPTYTWSVKGKVD